MVETKNGSVGDIPTEELNDVKLEEFKIVSMTMKDAEKGKVLWKEDNWDLTTDGEK